MRMKTRLGSERGVQRRPFEADQIDVSAVDGRRQRVLLHARATAQIPDYDNSSSHLV